MHLPNKHNAMEDIIITYHSLLCWAWCILEGSIKVRVWKPNINAVHILHLLNAVNWWTEIVHVDKNRQNKFIGQGVWAHSMRSRTLIISGLFGHILERGAPEADPGHTGGILDPIWPANTCDMLEELETMPQSIRMHAWFRSSSRLFDIAASHE